MFQSKAVHLQECLKQAAGPFFAGLICLCYPEGGPGKIVQLPLACLSRLTHERLMLHESAFTQTSLHPAS